MEFRILGPLEVFDDDRQVALGGSKQRALLALLLLNAGEVVSRDRLVDGLWGNSPPETATTALQVYVSQLRKVLGRQVIETRTPGYLICVEEGQLDLQRFEHLVDAARGAEPLEAAKCLREALALWRGPPLADLDTLEFAYREGARLEERRLTAVEQRIDAELEIGDHAALVPELERLVGDHPLRERLRGQLMLALYRSGRAAEALEVYQSGRRLLAEELGLEPGEALKRLERGILEQDPELAAEVLPARQRLESAVPTGTVTFVFSDIEDSPRLIEDLKDAYDELLDEHNRLLRAAVEAHGGLEIVNQDDAFFFVYRRARDAVAAAVASQLAVRTAAWARQADVRIRVGIHTCEPGITDGDYHGYDIVRAARVAGAASGGQILASSATRDLVEGALDEVSFHDFGEHRLPEIAQPQHIFQVIAPGLEEHLPPPRTQDGARVMSIAGREEELAAAAQAAIGAESRRLRLFRRSRVAAAVGALLVAGAVAGLVVAVTGESATVKVVPNSVALLDPAGRRLEAVVPVGKRPVAVAAGEGGVWVANADDQTVSRIDPETRKVVSTIGVGADVSDIAVGYGSVWVANGNDGTVTQIDPRLNAVIGTTTFGPQEELTPNPVFSVAVGVGGVWITRGNRLLRLAPDTGEPTTADFAIPAPTAIAVGRGAVWVTTLDERLLRIDPKTGERTAEPTLSAVAFAHAVAAGSVWLTMWAGRGQVLRVDPDSVTTTDTKQSEFPNDLAVGAGAAWVAEDLGTVRRIDLRSGDVRRIRIGLEPQAIAVDTHGVWVALQRPS